MSEAPLSDRYIAPGTMVRYDGLSDGAPDYGIVVHCWHDEKIGMHDCYVAFFGASVPIGTPTEKPYILRYAVASLHIVEPKAQYRDVSDVLARMQHTVPYLGIELREIEQTGMFGDTPLIQVMTWNDPEAATLLLLAGADLAATGEDGDTALHRAVRFGHAELVELLLAADAPISVKNDEDRTPLDYAMLLGNAAIIGLLNGEATHH